VQGNIAERRLRSMAQNNQRVFQPLTRYFSKGEKVFVKPKHANTLGYMVKLLEALHQGLAL